MKSPLTFVFIIAMAFLPGLLLAQQEISATIQEQAIKDLAEKLDAEYVFPEKGKEMHDMLLANWEEGAYGQLTDAVAFSRQLTEDISAITNDLHLRVQFDPRRLERPGREENSEENEEEDFWYGRENFGFKEVKILQGNIGYIDLRGFWHTSEEASEAASATMNFVANTDAIIFDLRQNGGGSPLMIQLLTSYLFSSDESIHLNSFYFRPLDETTQTWTLPYVPGRRNPDALVYVLTSTGTFSAAEEFTYNLKNLERATVIGEITGGGAHPGGMHPIGDRFAAFIPDGRAINPITGTNWEGVGVIPHIEIDSDKALSKAHFEALKSLSENASSDEAKAYYEWQKELLESELNPVTHTEKELADFVGVYGERKLMLEDGLLIYQRGEGPTWDLKALSKDVFVLKDYSSLKLKIEKEGKDYFLTAIYEDGRIEKAKRESTKP